jgi:hypothetical protein
MLCCTNPKSSWICSDSWLCWTCWSPVAVVPVAFTPARAIPRCIGRRLGSHRKQVWPSACCIRYQATSVLRIMSRSGTKKTRAKAPRPQPWVTGVDPAPTGKVSPIGCLDSFYQIGRICPIKKHLVSPIICTVGPVRQVLSFWVELPRPTSCILDMLVRPPQHMTLGQPSGKSDSLCLLIVLAGGCCLPKLSS